jgi:hypothetical protein
MLAIEPTHERALSNLEHYKQILREELQKLKGDTDKEIDEDSRRAFEFHNERPASSLGIERDSYEYLCRENVLLKTKRLIILFIQINLFVVSILFYFFI